ncbi:MAG: hypothetical protein PF487_01335 [Bacteroidales bacterium]|jgi:hypothetical protein|nr:hypothetical protein [Bacteroidales bacterium]
MKNFYLVIIKNDGKIIHDIFASSHQDLIEKYFSIEEIVENNYLKAVFSPNEHNRLDDVENYKLINSGMYFPEWFDDDFNKQVYIDLKKIIKSMIIKGRKKLLLHEGAILTKNAVIDEVKHTIIFGMYDKARIKIVNDSSCIEIMTDDAMINVMRNGSKILKMYGFSKVKEMRNYSNIVKMYGRAVVEKMYDHSKISMLKGDAMISEMHEKSKAERLKHMSGVKEMHGHSIIQELWNWTIVEKMFDDSRIAFMDEESKVLEMFGYSIIEEMYGNSVVEKLYENSVVRKLNDAAQILTKKL